MNGSEALREALEATDAWDFSEVDDGLELDIIRELEARGFTITALGLDAKRLAQAIMRADIFGPEGIPPIRWDLYAGTIARAIAKADAERRR